MKAFLLLLVVLAAGVVCLGFYRGWFSVASDKTDDKSNVTFSMDTDKMNADRKTAIARVQEIGHQKDKGGKSMDGTLVRLSGDKLTMANKEGKEHGHVLAADVKVTCDGKVCKAADLKEGMRIRVTTKNDDPEAAIRIEALDKNRDFEQIG